MQSTISGGADLQKTHEGQFNPDVTTIKTLRYKNKKAQANALHQVALLINPYRPPSARY